MDGQLKSAQETLNKFAVPDSEPVVVNTKDAALGASKVTLGKGKNADVKAGGVGVKLNQSMFLNNQNGTSDYERAQNSLSIKVSLINDNLLCIPYVITQNLIKRNNSGLFFRHFQKILFVQPIFFPIRYL